MAAEYRAKIMELLEARSPDKTICPSEVLSGADKKDKAKMERVRAAAKVLIQEGKILATQKGEVIDLDSVVGPIRLKLT